MTERPNVSQAPGRFSPLSWTIALLMIALAFVAGGFLVVIPHITGAHAAGATLTVIPGTAHYKAQEGIDVKGAGYTPNESVKIYFNYTGPGQGTLEATPTADTSGAFRAHFPIPLAFTGKYVFAGIGQTSGLIGTTSFTLLPQLIVNPQAGGLGSKLYILGHAFASGETVNIYWNYTGQDTGTLITTVTADTNTGSFSTTGSIPLTSSAQPGTVVIAGVGQNSKAVGPYSYILYPPTLTLGPQVGSAQTLLTVTGYGFQEKENVNVYWNTDTTPVITAKTNGNVYGYMLPSTFTVPADTPPGSYTVKAVGQSSHTTITNTFTVVAPGSSLNISAGPIGAGVNVSAHGYTPGEIVNILWNYTGPGTGTNIGSATAGTSGLVNTSFIVPNTMLTAYTVAVEGASSGAISQDTFTVKNSLAVNPASTAPGTRVAIAGSGFKANEPVQISLDHKSGTVIVTTTADTTGNISLTATIPVTIASGIHYLIGVGKVSGRSFTTSLTLNTTWNHLGFDDANQRVNPYENTLTTSSVSGLSLKWTANTAKNLEASPVYGNGMVYISTSDGKLNAYNANTGNVKWTFTSNTNFPSFAGPAVDPINNLIFFGTIGYQDLGIPSPFYALDAQTGAVEWSMIIPWNDFGFPNLNIGSHTVYVGNSHEGSTGSLYAIDELTGRLQWQYVTNGGVWGEAAVDDNTHTVFTGIGNPSSSVVALDAATGKALWTFSVPDSGIDDDVGSAISIANGLVYLDSKNGNVYALHESDGTVAWSMSIGALHIGNVSSPALAKGILYVGSLDNNLYALNATTGSILWKTAVGGGIDSSPSVANGVVYFSAFDGGIYAVDAANGTVLWSYAMGGQSFSSPIVVNGWLYCGSSNGKFYAFSL